MSYHLGKRSGYPDACLKLSFDDNLLGRIIANFNDIDTVGESAVVYLTA